MNIYLISFAAIVLSASATYYCIRKQKRIELIVPLLVVWYYTFLGGIRIAFYQENPSNETLFQYLFTKMFSIDDATVYTISLLYYLVFFSAFILPLFYIKKIGHTEPRDFLGYRLRRLKLVSTVSVLVALAYYVPFLGSSSGEAAYYQLAKTQTTGRALVQVVSFIGMALVALGSLIQSAKNFTDNRGALFGQKYFFILSAVWFSLLAAIGDKGELVSAIIFYYCVYARIFGVRSTIRLGGVVLCLMASVAAIDFIRGFTFAEAIEQMSVGVFLDGALRLFNSNENIAAHMSMYGVLQYDAPIDPFASISSLVSSLPPRFLGIERLPGSYDIYAKALRFSDGQGFSIHHATGWYINGGIVGVALGGWILGRLVAWSFSVSLGRKFLFAVVAPGLIISTIPHVIRSGPEGYKTVFLMCFPIWLLLSFRKVLMPR